MSKSGKWLDGPDGHRYHIDRVGKAFLHLFEYYLFYYEYEGR